MTYPGNGTVDYIHSTSLERLESFIADGQGYDDEVVYTYNNKGLVESIDGMDADLGFGYYPDSSLPAMATTYFDPQSETVSFEYDSLPGGVKLSKTGLLGHSDTRAYFSYDDDGLVTRAGALDIVRDPTYGRITDTSLDNIVEANRQYTSFGELQSQSYQTVSGSDLFDVSYTYDDLGRIATITESVAGDTAVTRTYHYDGYGQLKSVDEDGVEARSYGYDLNGNRTHEDGLQVAVFDTQDRLTTYNGTTYTYTDSGSLTSKSDGVDTTTYQYDLLGNLRDVTLADGTAIHYEVDGKNRRIGKTVDGTPEYRFVYRDQLNPIAMFDGNGDLEARFVYGTKGHVPDYMMKDGETYRFITDHLGSVRLVVKADDGTIAQRIDYDEWGKVVYDSNPGFQPFGYAGGLYDTDTGLVRFGARDYDPSVGRWTAKDPILFEGRAGEPVRVRGKMIR